MAEHEAVAILGELRRIGADLDRPPGLAFGTGFRAEELLAWLHELPDGIGHDAFVERLTAHVEAAVPARVRGPGGVDDSTVGGLDAAPRVRWFPTHEQLAMTTDLLLEAWDPIGARLGAVPREEMAEHAFAALGRLLHRFPRTRREAEVAELLGTIEEGTFGVRRSPEANRRLLVRRVQSIIAEHPAPPLEYDPWEHAERAGRRESRVVEIVGPRPDDPPIRDPAGTCARCGAIGTIAAVSRVIEPKLLRFCASCWREVRHEYTFVETGPRDTPDGRITLYEQMHRGVERVASRSWDDVVDLIRMVTAEPTEERAAERAAYFPQLAREIIEESGDMDGPMPPEIESFVRQHSPPPA